MEDLALQHYALEAEGGWRGIHTEGGIWATLFGLVFWDILFSGGRRTAEVQHRASCLLWGPRWAAVRVSMPALMRSSCPCHSCVLQG